MSVNEKMTAIADAIRGKTGGTGLLTLDGMAAAIANISGSSGLTYDMGEFVLDADTASGLGMSIPHSLGAAPDFVCVWTDHWAGLTSDQPVSYADAKSTAVGCIWLNQITGMTFRATSTNTGVPLVVGLQISNGDYRVGVSTPTSGAYGMLDGYVTDAKFSTPNFGINGARYRAGVTYKYFISKAWWNVGGTADVE